MQVQTKFLWLRKPVAIGDQVDGWRVCWIGGWEMPFQAARRTIQSSSRADFRCRFQSCNTSAITPPRLPKELQTQLSDTRIACARDLAKPVTAEVSDGIAKLRVVDDVEKLSAELK